MTETITETALHTIVMLTETAFPTGTFFVGTVIAVGMAILGIGRFFLDMLAGVRMRRVQNQWVMEQERERERERDHHHDD